MVKKVKWKGDKEAFQQKMNEYIQGLLNAAKESSRVQQEIADLHNIQGKLMHHRKNMHDSLKKHLKLEMFPNDCEYYHWVK